MTSRTPVQRFAAELHRAADDARLIAARHDLARGRAVDHRNTADALAALTLNLPERPQPGPGQDQNASPGPQSRSRQTASAARHEPDTRTSGWSREFTATPDQVSHARRFLAELLNGHPATDAAVSCLSELVNNAIQHSRSARPGGAFAVRMRRSGPAIRIEVTDQGGPWRDHPAEPADSEHGRGLNIVRQLSDRHDITLIGPADNPSQRTIWFEIQPR